MEVEPGGACGVGAIEECLDGVSFEGVWNEGCVVCAKS